MSATGTSPSGKKTSPRCNGIPPSGSGSSRKNGGIPFSCARNTSPEVLKNIAASFDDLERERAAAVESSRGIAQAQERRASLEKEIAQILEGLTGIDEKIARYKPQGSFTEEELKEYNALITQKNSFLAKIDLARSQQDALQRQAQEWERKTADYLNDFTEFKRQFKELASSAQGKESSYFTEAVGRRLAELEEDFTTHLIDYRDAGDAIVVEALVNDAVKVHLVLDTGATVTVISKDAADRIGLDTAHGGAPVSSTMADGSVVSARGFTVPRLKVGDVEVTDSAVEVLGTGSWTHEDGLLGMSFLKRFLVTIDKRNNKLILQQFSPQGP